eukprot:4916478-Pleurochrysis_carterae.AAC.3
MYPCGERTSRQIMRSAHVAATRSDTGIHCTTDNPIPVNRMLSLALLPSLAFSLAVRGGIGHAQSALAHGRDASALLRRRVTSPVLSGTNPPLDVENMVIIGSGPAG